MKDDARIAAEYEALKVEHSRGVGGARARGGGRGGARGGAGVCCCPADRAGAHHANSLSGEQQPGGEGPAETEAQAHQAEGREGVGIWRKTGYGSFVYLLSGWLV